MASVGDEATGPGWTLRCGRWEDVLSDVRACAVVCDPPYSERTQSGALDATTLERGVNGYTAWSEADARRFVEGWAGRCRGWMALHTDDVLAPAFIGAAETLGRYAFPKLPILQQQPRVAGDGPASHGHYLCVSRPRERRFLQWGSLPGWYVSGRDGSLVRGGKPIDLARAIIRDYSRPGDLVCDPCAGGGTTLLASVIEGRRAIGAEQDPDTFAKAVRRLRAGFTPTLEGIA